VEIPGAAWSRWGRSRGREGNGGGRWKKKIEMENDAWGPSWVVWIDKEYKEVIGAGEVDIRERISPTRQKYSILKDDIKDDECGWS
jgi:hypothetical protein